MFSCEFSSPILAEGKSFVELSNSQEWANATPVGSGGIVDMQYFIESTSKFSFVTIDGFTSINDTCMIKSVMTITVYDYI